MIYGVCVDLDSHAAILASFWADSGVVKAYMSTKTAVESGEARRKYAGVSD